MRALDPSIDVQERETMAGQLIEAKSTDSNIPTTSLIMSELNDHLVIRLEISGNITQYIVNEIIAFLQKNFKLAYLEVTENGSH